MALPAPGERRQPVGAPVRKNREELDPDVRKAAEGLESLFLDTMFRTMRNTVQKSELSLDNSATEIYRGMLDSETAKGAAKAGNGGIGLADQIVAYLESRGYTKHSSQGRTGGTNENQSKPAEQRVVRQAGNQNRQHQVSSLGSTGRETQTDERRGDGD